MESQKVQKARFEFRCSVELLKELKKVSDKSGETMASLIRNSIRRDVADFNRFQG